MNGKAGLDLARGAYLAYGDRVGWVAMDGQPMRLFDDLGDVLQDAWLAAARRAVGIAMSENDQTVAS